MSAGVGLDIGADSVKVVAVRESGGQFRIVGAARVPRSGPEFPAAAVADAVSRAGLPRGVMIGASGKDVMIRYIPVPPVPPWRLKMLVEFEIRENMAGGGADVSSDYSPLNIGGGMKQGLTVLAAVAKNTYLDERFNEARSAGLKPVSATPGAVALYRGFAASSACAAGETTFLLDVGRETCEMAIQRDGDLLFARATTGNAGEKLTTGIDGAFGIGRDRAEAYKRERARLTLTPPEDIDKRQVLVYGALREIGDGLVGAVNSGLRFARMQTKIQDLDYDRIVLSGGGARLAGLKEYLENRLQKKVTLFDPAAAFDSNALRGAAAESFGGAPSEMAVATGLAVASASSGGFTMELVPPREAAARTFWGRTVYGYAAAAVGVILAATMFIGEKAKLSSLKDATREAEAQIADLRGRADAVRKLESDNASAAVNMSLMLERTRVNRALLDVFAAQREACPDGLNLTRFEMLARVPGDPIVVEFEGRGAGMEQAAFLTRLDEFRDGLEAVRGITGTSISEKPGPDATTRAFKCRVTVDPWTAAAEADEGSAPDADLDDAADDQPDEAPAATGGEAS